ncbi:MAG TPA: Do family serine endopeptidase [Devosiaceae bacterium]|nr:Do family serine endopeptidase [Devosiaceae bacterium]
MISKRLITVGLGSAISGLLLGYLVLPPLAQQDAPQPPVPVEAQAPLQTRELPESEAQIQLSFAPVVSHAAPSVVNVYATTVTEETVSPFATDPFFRRFFGGGDMLRPRPRQSQSLGSGVVVDAAGVVLTNSHVVGGATDIRISTADGREFAVDLVLDDPETDLAVLRVREPGNQAFAALPFADSDRLAVGDLVLAIGNPFGVGQTVTSGIVSALARTGVESSNYEFFIQTDAAINPGNSGGALIDLDGRLVGINTAIFTRTGGSIGIGFAIPANMAKVVAEAGIAGGILVRPWFGARLQEVTPDIADSLGLDRARGALITEIAPGGSAEAAGFRSGDVILTVDGFPVHQPNAFDFRLATKPIGTAVEIGYFRDGREASVTVELQAAPGSGELVEVSGNTRFRGVTVATLTPAIAQELGLPYSAEGVVVRSVAPGSPADVMGLQTGDIILNLNGRDTTDAETFRALVEARPQAWQIVLQRGGRVFRSVVSG